MRSFSSWGGLVLSVFLPTAAPFLAFVANEVYLTDPSARQLVAVNVSSLQVMRRMDLSFRPSHLAWLGTVR